MPFNCFAKLINDLFDYKKTVKLWKYGMMIKDCGCEILIKISDKICNFLSKFQIKIVYT
jgi:hypothetical protein